MLNIGLQFLVDNCHIFRDALLHLKNSSNSEIKIGKELFKKYSKNRQNLCQKQWNLVLGENFAPNDILPLLIMYNDRCLINSIRINYYHDWKYVCVFISKELSIKIFGKN